MTTLRAPVTGPAEEAETDHAECGKLATNAVVQLAKPGINLASIPDYATAADIVKAVTAANIPGVTATRGSGNAADLLGGCIKYGTYLIALVQCLSNATPCPVGHGRTTHWIPCYGDDLAAVPYYQCWNASHPTLADLRECSLSGTGYHALITVAQTPPTTTTESDNMPGFAVFDGTEHEFWVDPQGGLRHRKLGSKTVREAVGLRPGTGVNVVTRNDANGPRLDLFAYNADGSLHHGWFYHGDSNYNSENES